MRKSSRPIVAISVAVALLLASCASGGTSSPSAGGSKTLTVGAAQGIGHLNPAESGTAWELVVFPLMYNGLVKIGKNGDLESDLATSWSSSADLKTWTFELVPNVKFSNGKALTAADVVSTFKYYKQPDTPTQFKNNLAPIKSVDAASGTKVKITLNGPNALFPTTIDSIKILDMDSMNTIKSAPVVTGPYKVEKFVANDTLTLVRNPKYFGAKQGSDKINLVTASDSSAAITGLQSGDLNSVWSVPLSQVKSIEQNPNLKVIRPSVIGQYVSWETDLTSPPFDDVHARQALAYAIDRDAILRNAYYGQGTTSPTNNPLADNSGAFGGDLTDYSFDLDKAKKLFAEAGITEGSTITWYGVSNQYPEWNTSAQILQASLAKIGIKLNIKNVDIASWPEKFYPAGKKFPGMVIPNFQSYQPVPSDLFQFLRKDRCECNWNNPKFDALYNEALATEDKAERNKIWAQMQELVNQEVPILVPVQFATVTAAGKGLTGVWVDGTGTPHYEAAVVK